MNNIQKVMALLNDSGLTQSLIAKETGVNQAKLSKIKSGQIEPANMTYVNVITLVDYYDKLELMEESNLKILDLMHANYELLEDKGEYDNEEALESAVVGMTIADYEEHLDEYFPNTSDHNEQVMNWWSEMLESTTVGELVTYDFDYDDDTKEMLEYVKNHGLDTYYNEPFKDTDGVWHISILEERDLENIVKSFNSYKF